MTAFGLRSPRPKQPRDRGPALSPQTRMRIADIEDRLARGEPQGTITRAMQAQHGVHPRTVRRWLRAAELRWNREADESGRPGRIAQLEAITMAGIRKALERKGLAVDREGGEHWYDNPDIGGLARLLEFKARLRGDLAQPGASVTLGFGDDALKALAQFYGGAHVVDAVATVVESEPALPAGDDERGE